MVVVVNAGTDCSVVLVEFVSLDFAVSVPVVEVRKELLENLVFSHLSFLNFGVVGSVVHSSQVVGVNVPVAVFVELQKGFVYHGLSAGVGCAADPYQELVEVDSPVSVFVEVFKQHTEFLVGKLYSAFPKSHCKFFLVHLFVSIVAVELSEHSPYSSDGAGSS